MRRSAEDFKPGELVRIPADWFSPVWAGALCVVVGSKLGIMRDAEPYVVVRRLSDGVEGGWYADQLVKPEDEEQSDA